MQKFLSHHQQEQKKDPHSQERNRKSAANLLPEPVRMDARYLRGMEYRMEYDTQADHAVPMKALVTLLDYIKKDDEECKDRLEANKLWKIGAFICMVTLTSLKGYEGFYTDLAGLRTHLEKGKNGVVPPDLTHKSIPEEKAVASLPHVAI